MALSSSELHGEDTWLTIPFPMMYRPVMDRRRRSKLLTPYGWFLVLSLVAMAAGAALGFAT